MITLKEYTQVLKLLRKSLGTVTNRLVGGSSEPANANTGVPSLFHCSRHLTPSSHADIPLLPTNHPSFLYYEFMNY